MMRPTLFAFVALTLPIAAGCEPEQRFGAASSPQTSRLGLSADGDTLYVALADHDEVRAVDAKTGQLRGQVNVTGYPHRLTVLADGRVAVVAKLAGTVSVVDVEKGETLGTAEVGSDPWGVVEVDGSLWVAVAGEGDLARIDRADLSKVAARVPLAHGVPRGLAKTDDGKLVVSHSTGGFLSVVDPARGEATGEVDMHMPSRVYFQPTQQDSVTVAPDGDVAVPHVECNNDPAQFGAGGTDLAGASNEYYVQGPTGYPAVVPAISRADVDDEVLLSDDSSRPDPNTGLLTEQTGTASPLINPVDRVQLEETLVNAPTTVAIAHGGALELVVAKGSGNVIIRRSVVEPGQSAVIGVVDVGVGADSIQVGPDGNRAYVYNAFDDEVVVFDIPAIPKKTSKYADDGGRGATTPFGQRKEPLQKVDSAERFTIAEPVLPNDVREGRKLFFGVDERMTRFGAVSCNSCHPNGSADSTTWQFAEGPRQSPPLWGGISDSAPFHWDSAAPRFADISSVTIQGRMGGAGLDPSEMDKIAAFLDTIPAPAAPKNADGASIERGAAIFFSDAAGCTACHSGDDFSDGIEHDVMTGPGFTMRESRATFATPVLHGLAHTAPYLHDGSQATLEAFVENVVRQDRMGQGSHLSEQDAADLVAFLQSL